MAQARELLDSWPRSSWLQYARLDDHLGSIWRADALADMNFDGIGDAVGRLARVRGAIRRLAGRHAFRDAAPSATAVRWRNSNRPPS